MKPAWITLFYYAEDITVWCTKGDSEFAQSRMEKLDSLILTVETCLWPPMDVSAETLSRFKAIFTKMA